MISKKDGPPSLYYSLTPKKNNFCEQPEEKSGKEKKRLSALLTSINIAFSETKQKEAAIHQRYFQKSFKNYIRISDIRKELAEKSRKVWSKAVNSAKKATTLIDLEKAVELANKAV